MKKACARFYLIVQVCGDAFCVEVAQNSFYDVMGKISVSSVREEYDTGKIIIHYFGEAKKYIGFVLA